MGEGRAETKSRGDRRRLAWSTTETSSPISSILGAHVFSSTREAHMCVRSIHWPRAAGRREGQRGLLPLKGQTSTNGRTRRAEPRPRGASLGVVVGRQAGLEQGRKGSHPPPPILNGRLLFLPCSRPPAFSHPRPPITCVYWPSPNMPPITAPDAVIALPVMHGAGGTPVPHSHTQTLNLQSTLGSTAQSSQPLHQPLSHHGSVRPGRSRTLTKHRCTPGCAHCCSPSPNPAPGFWDYIPPCSRDQTILSCYYG
jgi:hypothetical protein